MRCIYTGRGELPEGGLRAVGRGLEGRAAVGRLRPAPRRAEQGLEVSGEPVQCPQDAAEGK